MRFSTFVTLAMGMASIANAVPVSNGTENTEDFWQNFLLPEAEAIEVLPETVLTKRTFNLFGKSCKTMPGDLFWPSNLGWNVLKFAVGGRLLKPKPAGRVCHNSFEGSSTYDAAACSQAQAGWYDPDWHFSDPIEPLWPVWANHSCSPIDSPNNPCTYGKYSRYVVEAKTVLDVQMAINWARNLNLRLVVRNTGHDFMGKSMGAGSLGLWTHNFKELKFYDNWTGPGGYNGQAMKVGSGWQTEDLYRTLKAKGKVFVGGECAGVGFSGGYIQGGGHGPLSPLHGMATDQVLEFELVKADGTFVKANANTNKDLFWALRGGGAATWGVVTSVTVKTFPDSITSANVLIFDNTQNADKIWEGITIFHEESYKLADLHKFYIYYELGFAGPNSFRVKPILAPGKTAAQVDALLAPLFTKLNAIGLSYTQQTYSYSNFYDCYMDIFEGEGAGFTMYTSARLFKFEHVYANNTEIIQQFRNAYNQGHVFVGHILAPGRAPGGVGADTSVNPIFKEMAMLPLYNYILPDNVDAAGWDAAIEHTLNDIDAPFQALSPGGGTYLNEMNIFDPDWQQNVYGVNWNRLAAIKEQVDPRGVFYAETAVGSQNWKKVGANDRLCPV